MMNERIRELAEQAYRLTVLASHSELHKCVIGSDYFNALEKEKFAELIVKECADISDASFHNGSAGYTAILKHFGVE